ncbi:MAG: GNAT family N-acetyltransferase [Actinomycetia bacterium]|nr:GNAT family N-acetyltransferase [Actinomycetes bacterium]
MVAAFDRIRDRYFEAIAGSAGMDVARFRTTGTVVVPEPKRAGSSMAVAYQLDHLCVIRTDPGLSDAVERLASPTVTRSSEEVTGWAEDQGWLFIDGGDSHLINPDRMVVCDSPPETTSVVLDRDEPRDVDLIAELIEGCSRDDLDDAEIDLDDLDPLIVGLVDDKGRIGAYASGRPWDDDALYDDIGVITIADRRGQGWGAAVVNDFVGRSLELNRFPLYRCNWSNTASKALAMSLGFEQVVELVAVGPTPPGSS